MSGAQSKTRQADSNASSITNDDHNQLEETHQQTVLANPEGCPVEQLKTAPDTLDDDERLVWLDEVYEKLEGTWSEVLETLAESLGED